MSAGDLKTLGEIPDDPAVDARGPQLTYPSSNLNPRADSTGFLLPSLRRPTRCLLQMARCIETLAEPFP
jgi:hypothetical protein